MTESMSPTRRRSSFFGLRVATAVVVALAAAPVFAQGAAPRENVDFFVVKPVQPTSPALGKVEAIEFFGYWCPHCHEFEPTMSDWAKRNDAKVSMTYVPISFAPAQAGLQKLYYTLDALGREKELRRKVFAAIHDERSLAPSADENTMADWAAKNGIDRKKFVDTLNSFTVQAKVNRANQIAQAYGVTGVPMLAIGGKYLLNVQARTIGTADVFLDRVLSEK